MLAKKLRLTLSAFLFSILLHSNVYADESTKGSIEMQCGDFKWVITCGRDLTPKNEDSRECNMNKLTVTSLEGRIKTIDDPPITHKKYDDKRSIMIEGVTPTGMSCLPRFGKFYVSIMYSRDCGTVGLFYDLFKNSGTRLTSVGVPLKKGFKDPSESLNWQQLPKIITIEERCK